MERIVNRLGKLNRGKRAYAVLILCATAAIALPAQTFTTLHSFDGTDGSEPFAGLVQGTDGNLHGTTPFGGANGAGTVFTTTTSGTLTTLYNLRPQIGCKDGQTPYARLGQGTSGGFYGTTAFGGTNGGGTIFKINASGALETLYSFCPQSGCTDGVYPFAGLSLVGIGLYGTTEADGAHNGVTVFQIAASGKLTRAARRTIGWGCMTRC